MRILLSLLVAFVAIADESKAPKVPEITDAQRVEMLSIEAAYWRVVAQKQQIEARRAEAMEKLQKICEAGGAVFSPDILRCRIEAKQ